MKKTFSLILLTASCAMAATEVDLTGKWNGNTADLSGVDYSNGQFSVVLTLDMSKIRGDMHFFTVSGTNPNKDTATTSYGYGYDSFQGATSLVAYKGTPNLGFNFNTKLGLYDNDCAYTTMVFNYSYTSTQVGGETIYTSVFNMTMLKWDKDGNLTIEDPIYRSNTYKGYVIANALTLLEISDRVVTDIELYTGNFSAEESVAEANRMADELFGRTNSDSNDNVPEPTTATLSLLALAALASRRRRK